MHRFEIDDLHVAGMSHLARGDPMAAAKAMRDHIDHAQALYKQLTPPG